MPLAVAVATPAAAESSFRPTGAFLQTGIAGSANSATAGLTWRWDRQWALGSGVVSGYWAAAVSGWRYESYGGVGHSTLGQVSFTPVIRYTAGGGQADWFIEGGIGATYMNRIYATNDKRFSTRFNFGDQIAIGAVFGPAREYEVSLRFEHFSNADIKRPNPGEDFIQFRLSMPLP